jgi:hypothetical protein
MAMRNRIPFGLPQNVIESLDADDDGSISDGEAKGLLSGDAHLHLLVDFSSSDSPTIHFISGMPSVRERLLVNETKTNQITIADERLQLTIRVVQRLNQPKRIADDAFNQLDSNDDGYLQESEILGQFAETFSSQELDEDDDGKLTLREINQSPLRTVPVWAYQIRGRAAESPDRLFGWLDINRDQSLSTREILAAEKRLRGVLLESKILRLADIPESYVLTFVRGDPAQDSQTFHQSPSSPTENQRPPWATQMDFNRDGEISRKEFIGSESQFNQLDSDEDGFIESDELDVYASRGTGST